MTPAIEAVDLFKPFGDSTAVDGLTDMVRVAGWLRDSEIDVDDIGLSRPSLDDVFLSLTGHRTEEEVGP
jgi:ABC-2 type transport system ATP-binding protein